MNEEFYVGQIFEEIYPTESADWCNTNQKIMVEIEPENEIRRFQIQEKPEPSEEELKQRRIAELKSQLNNTDYVVIKIAEAETIEKQNMLREHYSDVIVNRKHWREEINSLEQ